MKSSSFRIQKLSVDTIPYGSCFAHTGVWSKNFCTKVQKNNVKVERKCFIHTYQENNNSNKNNEEYIQDLFKDRIAPVIPFDRNLIKGSCLNFTDMVSKAKFLKE